MVKCEEYSNHYKTPVLTAGQSFILGYTNEEDGHFVATKDEPVIIFDDFTTSTQWIDFEFKVKSSAMKILEPFCRDLVDIRYLFFAIKNTRYTPSTHSRQWIDKFAKFVLALPPLAEQKRIVARLEELLKAADTLETCAEKFNELSDKACAKILDLAIRGKLVPQDANEEPAEALLAKIRDEKAKLVKAKEIKKEKTLPPITDDEKPFDLPSGWAWCRFGDVLNYIRPDNYIVNREEYSDQYDTPVLTAGQSFILGYTNEKDGHFVATKEKPVIIFDDFTTSTQWIDFEFKVKSSAMKILEPFCRDFVDIRYLFFAIKNTRYTPSTHSRQWIDKFAQFVLALPPLAEQKRIVAKVEAMLAACEKLKGTEA